jgi:hypothetical protein
MRCGLDRVVPNLWDKPGIEVRDDGRFRDVMPGAERNMNFRSQQMPYEICEILSQKHICRLCDGKSELIMGRGDVSHTYNQCSK